ncbi:MAG: hypothetical protein H6711_15620 [Myxococcales bacterium]|nr:hypothetical protein [Myxococcales bacterium]
MLRAPAPLALLLVLGCGADQAAPEAHVEAAPAPPPAAAEAAPAAAAAPKLSATPAPPPRGPDVNLRDPAWFRQTLFEGATLVKQGRSPADEAGLFASQITMTLPEGVDRDACVARLKEEVGRDVPELREEDKDGRVTLSGETENYSVTLICGEAKGRMTSFISYRWTKLPSEG